MNKTKNGVVVTKEFTANYIKFGTGKKTLIMIPGVGDGLKTVKGLAVPFYMLYKDFCRDYTVYSFSRRNHIPKDFSIEDMAEDLYKCMAHFKIEKADIIGVSEGGMIGTSLSIYHKEVVNKLVLVVTTPKPTKILKESVTGWIKMAENNDYKNIMLDTAVRSYTGKYTTIGKNIYGMLSYISKPKSFDRFITLLNACLNFNITRKLKHIKADTLIIGAREDNVLGIDGSILLNKKIKNSELYIYEGYSHGVYEQSKDFNKRILDYLKK